MIKKILLSVRTLFFDFLLTELCAQQTRVEYRQVFFFFKLKRFFFRNL